jgi:1-deoxy-D-xylulose-5-phosphate reductoisomerase
MATLTILGSTGSIGRSALRVVKSMPECFTVYGLGCNRNIELLSEQINEFNPLCAAVADISGQESQFKDLQKKFPHVEFFEGEAGIIELAKKRCDLTVSAITGSAGLIPSIAALEGCSRLALANKETLVMAGDLFMNMAADKGVELIPVDSEHSAVFSLLGNIRGEDLLRIILTASGGSLRDYRGDFKDVTPEIALNHPTWSMGSKITIDSATLMNKGLEVIEARHLFNIDYNKIDVVIHPESIIHSMVETVDGAVYAHMGVADMALPILNAMTYPEKVKNSFGRLDFSSLKSLSFRNYNKEKFPALQLCYEAGRAGGVMPAVLNAANEAAVYAFLDRRIGFQHIVIVVAESMSRIGNVSDPSIEDIIQAGLEAEVVAESLIKEKKL